MEIHKDELQLILLSRIKMYYKENGLIESIIRFKNWRQSYFFLAILICLCGVVLWLLTTFLLPQTADIVLFSNPGIIIIVMLPILIILVTILMRFLFKDSLYFKMSTAIILIVALVSILTSMIYLFENTLQMTSIVVISGLVGVCYLIFHIMQSVKQPLDEVMDITLKLSEGDLNVVIPSIQSFGKEYAEMKDAYEKMTEYLRNIVTSIKKSGEALAVNSEELATTSEEVNALSEEIAATVQQISRGASNQSELSAKSVDSITKMSDAIDQSLNDVKNALQVIEDIASQTNILALNAAIEAARAGEYGRGFAVVADNVRRLAEETKAHAGDISNLTDQMVTNISGTVTSLHDTLQEFSTQSEEFSASSEEVAAATEEQTAAMVQMTFSAQNLSKLAEKLTGQMRMFKL